MASSTRLLYIAVRYIRYSGKLSREKTFANFMVLWVSVKVFSAKFGVVWHSKNEQSTKIVFFTNSQKFSPSKVSCYAVMEKAWKIFGVIVSLRSDGRNNL